MKCRPEEALFTCFPTTLMYIFFFKGPVDDPYRNLGTCPPGYRSQQESSGSRWIALLNGCLSNGP